MFDVSSAYARRAARYDAFDRARRRESPSERSKFARVRNAQREYEKKLRRIARTIGEIVRGYGGDDPVANAPHIREALGRYSVIVNQWARAAGASMVAEVMRRDEAAWRDLSKTMSRELAKEIQTAPTGEVARRLLEEQVDLITSLPIEAGQRVQKLAMESLATGRRADYAAREIMKSGEVCASRATLIARTEASKASSSLLQARAEYVGGEGYIWRTSEDSDVRPLHKKLGGKFFKWNEPPVSGENGERAHAGQIYNCRCWSEPVIPDE